MQLIEHCLLAPCQKRSLGVIWLIQQTKEQGPHCLISRQRESDTPERSLLDPLSPLQPPHPSARLSPVQKHTLPQRMVLPKSQTLLMTLSLLQTTGFKHNTFTAESLKTTNALSADSRQAQFHSLHHLDCRPARGCRLWPGRRFDTGWRE